MSNMQRRLTRCAAVAVVAVATAVGFDRLVLAQDQEKEPISGMIGSLAEMGLAAEHGTLFYAVDVLCYPDSEVDLTARVLSVSKFAEVKGATVQFRLGKEIIGKAISNKEGYARLKWKAPASGDQMVFCRIVGAPNKDMEEMTKAGERMLLVSVHKKTDKFVVLDLDHTIVGGNWLGVLSGEASPMPGSVEGVNELAKKYNLIYLTQRADMLTIKSKQWLAFNGFPRGPLVTCPVKQVLLGSARFKSRQLKEIRSEFPELVFGVGDKISDVQSYLEVGMSAYLIPRLDKLAKPKDVTELAQEIRKLTGKVQVVQNWEQITQSVSGDKTFSPAAYADWLMAHATEILRKRQEKKED